MKTLSSCLCMLFLAAGLPAECAPTALINFNDIPALRDGPGKGHYALFQGKLFEVLVATNLDATIYPLVGGQRSDKPIVVKNFFPKPLTELLFVSIVTPAPPAVNPSKLAFELVSEKGIRLTQQWKISDGVLTVENRITGNVDLPPILRTGIQFPRVCTFTDALTRDLRAKVVEGCAVRWRAGNTESGMRVLTVPYAQRVEYLEHCDWMEHKGPWGTRKVTLKRTNLKGTFQLTNPDYAAHGLLMHFITRPDARKKAELQGFELKLE